MPIFGVLQVKHSKGMVVDNKNNSPQKQNTAWWQPAMLMFARLSVWIIAPVLLATLIGKWLDKRFDSEPWGLLVLVGIAFTLSMIMIVVEAGREYKKIEKDDTSIKN